MHQGPLPRLSPRRSIGWLLALCALACQGCGSKTPDPAAPGATQGTGARPQAPAAAPAGGLVVLPGSNQVTTAAPGQEEPERPYFHSFGEVAWGEVVRHPFRVRNDEGVAVRLLEMQSSCGCSVAAPRLLAEDGTPEPARADDDLLGTIDGLLLIPPGRVAEFSVSIDTGALPRQSGPKHVMVRLTTDAPTTPWLTLEAHAHIDVGFVPVPAGTDFGRVPQGLGATRTIEIRQEGPRALRLTEVLSAPAGVDVRLEEVPGGARPRWVATLEVPLGTDLGNVGGHLRIAAVDARGESIAPLELPVVGQVVPDIDVTPPRYFLRPRPGRERLEQELRLLSRVPGLRFRVVGHHLQGEAHEHLEFVAEAVDPDSAGRSREWRISLSAPAGAFEGTFGGELRVLLDDPQHPEIQIPYVVFSR